MTPEELKAAYKVALDDVTAKKATVATAQAAYSAACADLATAQATAEALLVQIQEAIVAETL